MWSDCSNPPGSSHISGMALENIWHVKADESYDVNRHTQKTPSLIAIRTRKGSGVLELKPRGKFELPADSLIIVELAAIRSYKTVGRFWHFWWFQFSLNGPLPCPLNTLLKIPHAPRDTSDFNFTFKNLRMERFPQRCVSTAAFSLMMSRWIVRWQGERHPHPHQADVDRVIELMHEKLAEGWTVAEMARAAHLSVRRFRQVFWAMTRQPPKAFYDRLRVNMADRLLKQGAYNVTEVSDRLGFSSPFHFSKLFKKVAGMPPSKAIPANTNSSTP